MHMQIFYRNATLNFSFSAMQIFTAAASLSRRWSGKTTGWPKK